MPSMPMRETGIRHLGPSAHSGGKSLGAAPSSGFFPRGLFRAVGVGRGGWLVAMKARPPAKIDDGLNTRISTVTATATVAPSARRPQGAGAGRDGTGSGWEWSGFRRFQRRWRDRA